MQKRNKNKLRFLWMSALLCCIAVINNSCSVPEYNGSTYSEVWEKVTSDPYSEFPNYDVNASNFIKNGSNLIMRDAFRTVNDRNDLLPHFDKLIHPNGVCFSGTWNITEENPYTGYFSNGSTGVTILRASVALGETKKGEYRAFGLAGKIYPTTNPNHVEKLKTANFFVVDNFSGTLADHFLDAAMTSAPAIFSSHSITELIDIGISAGIAFGLADANPQMRQMHEVSELGLSDPETALTPKWMKIKATEGQIRVDEDDFRDELNLVHYPDGNISFDIYVTTPDSTQGNKDWMYIGYILLNDFAATDSCDHCLHFHHPRNKRINIK